MRGAGRWRLYGPLTCMGALRSDERASANRTEALYGVGALLGQARPLAGRARARIQSDLRIQIMHA